MSRLPINGADDNQWANILNDYLSQSINPDGTLGPRAPISFYDANGVVRSQTDTISGDFWFLSNATWNPADGATPPGNFYRIDNTHYAFGLQLQGQGFIPGEPDLGYYVPGATIWVAQPESYSIIRGAGQQSGKMFGAVGGWELGITVTGERQLTVGGGGIEIDGYGTIPYGRVVNNTTGTLLARRMVGMMQNAYTDLGGFDIPARESWYWGYLETYDPAGGGPPYPEVANSSRWAVAWIPPNQDLAHPVFDELFTVKPTGVIEVYQDPTTAKGIATKEYVDASAQGTVGLKGGEAFFSGNGTMVQFLQAHGVGHAPSRVLFSAMNQASMNAWITADATNIGFNFAVAPANTTSLAFSWSAYP